MLDVKGKEEDTVVQTKTTEEGRAPQKELLLRHAEHKRPLSGGTGQEVKPFFLCPFLYSDFLLLLPQCQFPGGGGWGYPQCTKCIRDAWTI